MTRPILEMQCGHSGRGENLAGAEIVGRGGWGASALGLPREGKDSDWDHMSGFYDSGFGIVPASSLPAPVKQKSHENACATQRRGDRRDKRREDRPSRSRVFFSFCRACFFFSEIGRAHV